LYCSPQSLLDLSMVVFVRLRLTGVPEHRTRHVRKGKSWIEIRIQILRINVSSIFGSAFGSSETHEELGTVPRGPVIPLGEGWIWAGCAGIALLVVVKLDKEHVVRDGANEVVISRTLWCCAEVIWARGLRGVFGGKTLWLRDEGAQVLIAKDIWRDFEVEIKAVDDRIVIPSPVAGE
jgi:hypothetical protein